jgi:hypothetical protein
MHDFPQFRQAINTRELSVFRGRNCRAYIRAQTTVGAGVHLDDFFYAVVFLSHFITFIKIGGPFCQLRVQS